MKYKLKYVVIVILALALSGIACGGDPVLKSGQSKPLGFITDTITDSACNNSDSCSD
jgi:hypothetical protein